MLYGNVSSGVSSKVAAAAEAGDDDLLSQTAAHLTTRVLGVLRAAPPLVWGETDEQSAAAAVASSHHLSPMTFAEVETAMDQLQKTAVAAAAEAAAAAAAPATEDADGDSGDGANKRRKIDDATRSKKSTATAVASADAAAPTDDQLEAERARPAEFFLGRDSRASYLLGKTVELVCLWVFLKTTMVPSLDMVRRLSVPAVSLTDYVLALARLPYSLYPYAFQRGTANDYQSLAVCQNLCSALKHGLSQFNFRNGPLRRAYDGLAHAERQYADFMLEHSLANPTVQPPPAVTAAVNAHADRLAAVLDRLLQPLVAVYGALDEKREQLIKGCRDVQKGSKTAIYDVQRGNAQAARDKLALCEVQVLRLLHSIYAAPPAPGADPLLWRDGQRELRATGSLTACLEEWAEGALLLAWSTGATAGRVLSLAELRLPLTTAEYVGALSDLSGEISRLAVKAATARDQPAVARAYASLLRLSFTLTAPSLPRSLVSKRDACLRNKSKIEKIIYEQSLSQRVGRTISSSIQADEQKEQQKDKDD